jgi:putative salt-induced outer membrane protein YdiY
MLLPLVLTAPLLPSVPDAPPSEPGAFPALIALDQAATPPTEGGPPKWTGSLNIGASYSDGNTDSRSINAAIDAERRSEKDRWTAKGWWNFAESRDSSTGELGVTDRRSGGSLKYDYFLSKKLYVFAVGGVESDFQADISLRYYAGPGVGYQWHETDDFKWGSEAGLTYFKTDYKSSEDKEYVAARFANNISWKINDHTQLENAAEIFPSLESADDFYGKSDTKLKVTLSEAMFAQLQWVYQYTSQPADGKERNDNLLVLGVGWKF